MKHFLSYADLIPKVRKTIQLVVIKDYESAFDAITLMQIP